MRSDERFHAALRDPLDARPLLLASRDSELAVLSRLVDEPGIAGNVDRLAFRIEQAIATGLGNSSEAPPFYRLASWAAQKLGSESPPQNLEEADEQITALAGRAKLDTPESGEAELSFAGGGDSRLLHLAITLARLRHKKLRRLRRWRGVLDRLVGRDKRPAAPAKPLQSRELAPREAYAESGEADSALWDIIKGAAGRLPLTVWGDKLRDARKDVGRFNIIVAGRTGVARRR